MRALCGVPDVAMRPNSLSLIICNYVSFWEIVGGFNFDKLLFAFWWRLFMVLDDLFILFL